MVQAVPDGHDSCVSHIVQWVYQRHQWAEGVMHPMENPTHGTDHSTRPAIGIQPAWCLTCEQHYDFSHGLIGQFAVAATGVGCRK